MTRRKLYDLSVFEISLIFKPLNPCVPSARILIAKNENESFYEREDVKAILRQVAGVVEQLKAKQAQREADAAEAAARRQTPKRYRTRTYEQFEDLAEHRNRQQANRDLYDRCAESARPMLDPTGKPYRTIAPELF